MLGLSREREYGKFVMSSWHILAFFGGVFSLVFVCSWSLLVASDDTLLAKIGTISSIVGVFLGTFIAVWLINQNRTRKIEERYFYKANLLFNTSIILKGVIHFLELLKNGTEEEKREKIVNKKEAATNRFKIYGGNIKIINSNTLIPASTRMNVDNFLLDGEPSFVEHTASEDTFNATVRDMLLCPLNRILAEDFFIDDTSKKIKGVLQIVKSDRDKIDLLISDKSHQ